MAPGNFVSGCTNWDCTISCFGHGSASLFLYKLHTELIAAIKGKLTTGPALVVLDTLNRSLRGSENDSKDMAAYIASADAIREAFNCAVAIVHHCGIDGTRPRGSTALSGAVDAQLSVKRDASDAIIVEVEFLKDGAPGKSLPVV
jgi:RecA-family ATPase